MDTDYGFVPLPEEGTEAFDLFLATEACNATTCRGGARDPYEAADLYGAEPWCPGHCARYRELTLRKAAKEG